MNASGSDARKEQASWRSGICSIFHQVFDSAWLIENCRRKYLKTNDFMRKCLKTRGHGVFRGLCQLDSILLFQVAPAPDEIDCDFASGDRRFRIEPPKRSRRAFSSSKSG
jgi:hypothetical protein